MQTTTLAQDKWRPSPRKKQEIEAEISLLDKLSTHIPPTSAFGDSNANALDTQLAVLQGRLTYDEVRARFEDDVIDQYVFFLAREAFAWLYEAGFAPSEDWLIMLHGDYESRLVN